MKIFVRFFQFVYFFNLVNFFAVFPICMYVVVLFLNLTEVSYVIQHENNRLEYDLSLSFIC